MAVLDNFTQDELSEVGGLRWCDLRDTLNANGGSVTNFLQDAFCDGSVELNSPVPAMHYCTCSTAASAQEKVMSGYSAAFTDKELIHVSFANTNTFVGSCALKFGNISYGMAGVTTVGGIQQLDNSHYYSFIYSSTAHTWTLCGIRAKTYYPNANVNLWAAFKPMPYNSLTPLTGTQQDATGRGIEVKRVPTSGNWTDITGGYDTLQAMYNDYKDHPNDTIKWIWRRPSGSATEPFRIGDYKGYYPAAQTFLKNPHPSLNAYTLHGAHIVVGDEVVRTLDANSINPYTAGSKMTIINSNRGNVSISDFYLGVMAVTTDRSNVVFAYTSLQKIGTTDEQDIVAYYSSGTSSFYFIYFLSSVQLSLGSGIPSQNGIFLPIPGNFGSLASINDTGNKYLNIFFYVDENLDVLNYEETFLTMYAGGQTYRKRLSQATIVSETSVIRTGYNAYVFRDINIGSDATAGIDFAVYAVTSHPVTGHTILITDDNSGVTWHGMTSRSSLSASVITETETDSQTEFSDSAAWTSEMLVCFDIILN